MQVNKVLVTGGAGFIGSHIVDKLIEEGIKVRVFDDLSNGSKGNINPKAEFVHGDIRNREQVRNAMEGIDAISHHAGLIDAMESIAKPDAYYSVNSHGTMNVFLGAIDKKIKRVVFASSSAVYGHGDGKPQKIGDRLHPITTYGMTKRTGENAARLFNDSYGTEIVCLRYFNVYGKRQTKAVIPRFIEALKTGQKPVIYGDGEQERDFVHVSDVARINYEILVAEEIDEEIVNVGTGEAFTINDVLEILEIIMSKPVDTIYKTGRMGDIRKSVADVVKKAKTLVNIAEGLKRTV